MGTSETTSNTPADESGSGPVTIGDRTEPGGEGSPGSNQSKAEPMSPPGRGNAHQGVPSSSTQTSPGTSEEHRVVAGITLSEADEA